MAVPLPKAEFACLSQLIFQLHSGLDAANPSTSLTSLLGAIPSLSSYQRQAIHQTFAAIPDHSNIPIHSGLVPLILDGEHYVSLHNDGSLEQTLTPFVLEDSFIVDISSVLRKQPLSLLRQAPITFQPSLGQCFILYVQSHDQSTAFINACARAVCTTALSPGKESTLLGRPIWDFFDGCNTWFLWLDDPENSIHMEFDGTYQQHLLHLLCCKSKMDYAARASADAFRIGMSHYRQIEIIATQIGAFERINFNHTFQSSPPHSMTDYGVSSAQSCSYRRMVFLEKTLSVLPQHGLGLAQSVRDITTHRLTFTTNAFNAAQAVKVLLQNGDNFLKTYLDQEGHTWHSQMKHDLHVLRSGQRYFEQLTSSLRAIVALEGQKLQRDLEEKEKARDRSLQLTIFFVGAALGISGLAAATRPRPTARLLAMLSNQQPHSSSTAYPNGLPAALLWLSDIAIHFFIGLLAALTLFLFWRVCDSLFSRIKDKYFHL